MAAVAADMHAHGVYQPVGTVPVRQGLAAVVHHHEQDIDKRQQQYNNGAGGSGSGGSGGSSNAEDSTPLRFTFECDNIQLACDDISVSFAGGCKPYSLSAMWFSTPTTENENDDDGNDKEGDQTTTWVKLAEKTWNNSFDWTVIAPISSELSFSVTDARGHTITSNETILVASNNQGLVRDTWCQYAYPGAIRGGASSSPSSSLPAPLAATASPHRYAWNASSHGSGQDGDGDGDDGNPDPEAYSLTSDNGGAIGTSSPTTSSMTKITYGQVSTATESGSAVSSTTDEYAYPEATDLNDVAATFEKAIHDADEAKILEGILAALLGLSLIALATLFFFLLKTRRRLRAARSELAAYNSSGGNGRQIMSEKRDRQGLEQRWNDGNANTPRAGQQLRNPFDENYLHPQDNAGYRSPFLTIAGTPNGAGGAGYANAHNNRNRMSTTSLVSAVPSHARSTAADSAVSTEFYHTYKASTIPPKGSGGLDLGGLFGSGGAASTSSRQMRESTTTSGAASIAGGRLRGLFAPMSFWSSNTSAASPPLPAASSSSSAASTTSTRRTTGATESIASSRPTTMSRSGSAETVQVPITRVSTRSDMSLNDSSSSSIAGDREDRRAASSSSITSSRSPALTLAPSSASGRSSSGNGADESSIQGDVYDDSSDAASFSNFSFVHSFAGNDSAEDLFSDSHAVMQQNQHYQSRFD